MIEAKNLSKTYGSLAVLNGVGLQVKTKEIVAITGPSGAGKTTLLNILGTLDVADVQPDRKLWIGGQDIFSLQGKELARFRNQQLGFVFNPINSFQNSVPLKTYVFQQWLAKHPFIRHKNTLWNCLIFESFPASRSQTRHAFGWWAAACCCSKGFNQQAKTLVGWRTQWKSWQQDCWPVT